jgi:hypothetical protein
MTNCSVDPACGLPDGNITGFAGSDRQKPQIPQSNSWCECLDSTLQYLVIVKQLHCLVRKHKKKSSAEISTTQYMGNKYKTDWVK